MLTNLSFAEHGLPLIAVAALWFAGTALVLWLDSRPAAGFGRTLAGASLLAVTGAVAIAVTVDDGGVGAAYLSFAGAFAIWAWHELSFLTGIVSGPNRAPCPPQLTGWARFRAAAATLIHHEVALALTTVLLVALAWGRANPTGAWAFALLFGLRLSAKLNIFAGVPAFADELLPPHLAYLRSYFGPARLTALLPLTLGLTVGIAGNLAAAALDVEGGEAVGLSLLAGLALLGVLEHLFLIMPFRDAALWRWARDAATR